MDDDARVRQFEAELQQAREEIASLRQHEAALLGEVQQHAQARTEALEQQAVTAAVLRIVASAPSDLLRVLTAVAENTGRLCDAYGVLIWRAENNLLHCVAGFTTGSAGEPPAPVGNTLPISDRTMTGRSVLRGEIVHVHDARTAEAQREFPESAHTMYIMPTRLHVPLIRDGVAIGAIVLSREQVHPFSDQQTRLIQTFADQAVIAIENARLFEELEQRNAELSESLERQTATAEILRVIATTPTDLPRVLDVIVTATRRLIDAEQAGINQLDGDILTWSASSYAEDLSPEHRERFEEAQRVAPRARIDSGSLRGRTVREGRTISYVHHDWSIPADYPDFRSATVFGPCAVVFAPLLFQGQPIGILGVMRLRPEPFTERQIALLESFADQAVVAIENARLFEALQEANGKLAEASQHKSQFLANMSHELRTPLNAIIGYSEMLQEEAEDAGSETFLPDLQRINSAGKHLLGLINDILDLSKIEAGRMDLFLETFEVSQLIQDVQAIVRPLVEKNGNTLVVECPDDIGSMHADLTKVRQTLFNLLSNAAKFTQQGRIELRVRERGRGVRGSHRRPRRGVRLPSPYRTPASG